MQGYRFELDWFLPIYEFKFPVIGSITVDGIYIELRHALEPWPVLGEQNISGYTSRLVDSTLSRIQIRCIGINLQKNIVACNGVRVPLKPCGLNNEYIAGIRFKAHDFKECLHPNIPAIDQLTIDIVDLQSSRSIGGCKYYSQHPGGKNSNQLPINRREAETRQRARFTAFGHSPGIMNITETIAQPEHSYILDLRKYSN